MATFGSKKENIGSILDLFIDSLFLFFFVLQPLGLGYSRVEFGAPDIFMCCSTEGDVPKTSCQSMPTNHIPDKKANPIWEIPCGNKEHAGVVSAITFGFAIATALLIVWTSISYSSSESSHKSRSW